MRINDQRVYRRADTEMVDLAGNRPVYSVDYFTTAVAPRYLAALREEFRIPDDVDLVVHGENDLPSHPPPGYITLSAEYFGAGLRLPFHPYLRRALYRLNVAPAQLNANVYRILVSCFVLWTKHFAAELPFRAFQNLYRMKSAPPSSGFYYFQGLKGTFITGCPDTDKQFKHLWFYAGGRWLHEHLAYTDFPPSERVPLVFRRGYVWTRAPHIPDMTLARVEALRELFDPERNQQGLLSLSSLAEHNWFGSSSTSGRADDQLRISQLETITIARLPEPTVHYHSRTGDIGATAVPDRSGVPKGVSVAMVHDPPSDDPSPRARGPRIADKDVDLVIRELFPARGLSIEEHIADRERRGTKRPSGEDRIARLQKMAKIDKGKGKSRTSDPPSRLVVPPITPTTRAVAPPAVPAPQAALPPAPLPTDCSESHSCRSRDDRQVAAPAPRSLRDDTRPRDVSTSEDELASDCAEKLIEGLCLAFSGSAAARGYVNRMADELKAAESEARHVRKAEKDGNAFRDAAREAQKKAKVRAKSAEGRVKSSEEWARIAKKDASNAEIARCELEEALRKAKSDLASAQAEHDRYVKVVLPAALEVARAQAVEDFLQSEDFNSRLVVEYQESIRDMKAGFTVANPSLVGVDWSFVSAESEETAAEEVPEEGEVSSAARAPEDVVVLDDPDEPATPEQPVIPEQPIVPEQPTSVQLGFSLPDQLD
ncbi:hypothetical protein TIFTF001_021886 [Ficus carica]|uniref:Uncharacterized protein n=1 Tax=Ficus carica TaxID=3494 RepID=A0AA88AV95_FICCA|nr:hypothetical protein TIFTF001_021886 [Ficus carica]